MSEKISEKTMIFITERGKTLVRKYELNEFCEQYKA